MPEEKTGQIQKIPVGDGTDPGQVVGDLTASIQSFFISSQFSDLVVKTEEQEFKLHRLIVCGQSEYFARLYQGNWAETADNTIQLNDDDPRAIEAMIHFMYGIDYDSSGNELGRISPMIFNVRLYQVADKYFVPRLKQRAKEKFGQIARTCWEMDDFPVAIAEAYHLKGFVLFSRKLSALLPISSYLCLEKEGRRKITTNITVLDVLVNGPGATLR
ncbi:Uncharacterized protein PEX1_065780 [Penicillium expansum]|uniref:BTB domain-containing protein n=1 Tax=Penicillium expansum TaxID=27334 RepID=A0A0A2KD81_PENEN|nr:Uncharacterized protein PEX2_085790 [Penicillium expansum]KGO37196.1 Uncharacterized protein PEXP_002210 [Penicillium expansum]KGO61504.1 Uncharacterized protein PEX2_085790 [Penicillium expansum]KGO62315.1 Uncharacterized protein PEX1_065780 [Penicillium expansum]